MLFLKNGKFSKSLQWETKAWVFVIGVLAAHNDKWGVTVGLVGRVLGKFNF